MFVISKCTFQSSSPYKICYKQIHISKLFSLRIVNYVNPFSSQTHKISPYTVKQNKKHRQTSNTNFLMSPFNINVLNVFYVNDEPESKFLYTETIKLYCIVLLNNNNNNNNKRHSETRTCWYPHSKPRFPAPSSKLWQNWLRQLSTD